jgi:hypothetical protein
MVISAKEMLSASWLGRCTAWARTTEWLTLEPVCKLWRKPSLLSSPGIKPRLASHSACSLVVTLSCVQCLTITANQMYRLWFELLKQDRLCTYVVMLWSVRVTIVAIGKQQWVHSVLSNYVCRCQQYELEVLTWKGNSISYFGLLLSSWSSLSAM